MNWLHRFATFLTGATFLLLIAGSLVATTGSGLSVPDWPTTYGWSLFTYPYSMWTGGIFYQQMHRLAAATVGLMVLATVVEAWRHDAPRSVKLASFVALVVVALQALLGGLAVLTGLPAAASVIHAALAQIVFCLAVSIALFSSRGWLRAYANERPGEMDPREQEERRRQRLAADVGLRRLAAASVAIVFVQILIGAMVRHTAAGLAIPDFPLAFGRIVPSPERFAVPGVALQFVHRAWAVVSLIAMLTVVARIVRLHASHTELLRPAWLLATAAPVQIALGGLVVVTGRNVYVSTALVALGALILATTLVIALRAYRPLLATGAALAERDPVRSVRLAGELAAGVRVT